MTFDPIKAGGIPVKDTDFDPLKAGGVPINYTQLQQQIEPKEKGFFEKTAEISDKIFGGASKLLYGSTAKTVGTLLKEDLISGAEALGKKEVFGANVQKLKEQQEKVTPLDIALTALELYPGGGVLAKELGKLPGGARVLEYIAKLPEGLKKSAIKQYSSIFNATSKESKALVKETVPELLARGEKVISPERLVEKAELNATTYGEKIDKFFQELPSSAKEATKPILDKLVAFKNKYIADGKVIRPEAVKAAENTMEKITQFGKEISTESARKVRQIFDEHFDISKGIEDIATYTKKAERAAADAIRAEFAKTRPELAKLNGEFTFWKNVQDLAAYTAEKSKKGITKSLTSLIGGAIGFQTGEGAAGKTTGTLVGLYLGAKGVELLRSPAWKSTSAILKNNLAEAIIRGDTKEIGMILGKITAGAKNAVSED